MKKTFIFVLLILLAGYLSAQPACLKDVIYALQQLKQIPNARKMMEENCFPGNESSPDVWLVRGNVFIQCYEYELERKKEPKYSIRWPDAIIIANESFYKAVELKHDIKPPRGLISSQDGQLLTAPIIHDMAADAMEKRDYQGAIKLLNMVIRSYRISPIENARNLSIAYFDLANCYRALGDEASYKKILLDAAKLNVPIPQIYLTLYDIFKQENDTVKCGEILTQARKVIPDSLATNVKGYELDYFAMIRDTAKLKKAVTQMFEQFKDKPAVINIIVGHLLNIKEYALAEEMIKVGLEIAPNDFDLNQQMTYRYFYEALDYDKIKEEKLKIKRYLDAEAAVKKTNEILESAVIWADKAYQIRNDDKEHNIMFGQILVRLDIPFPEGLKEKIDSYRKQ